MHKNQKIGIVGSGTMGNGIAHVFAQYGYNVFLVDLNQSILDKAIKKIELNMQRQVKKEIISKNQLIDFMKNIIVSTDLESLKDSHLVIEAVSEKEEIKTKIFKSLDSICNSDTILASNTSSISITKIAEATKRPDKVIGMHFMNPVPVMKLIEIIKGNKTSSQTLKIILDISKFLNKIPLECNDSPGFISNRILMPLINEAAYCLMDKIANKEAIDGIMKLGMGHPMGPLMLADLIGIDVCVSIMNVLKEGLQSDKYAPCPLLISMLELNKLGKKTNEGFYKY
ncbi:MAG: 3-hydroxybutyryl-CoA dehydrogenase [Candidatus Marinimicrobia bacterium]|nr:3-hydroxybutyryl-CoA dehydrogenase [Candidatus Neomarinimicrobiota bacterium]